MSRQRVYSLRTRQIAVDLVNELQEKGSCLFKGTEIKSLRQLANSLDVRDESTLRYWARKGDWSRSATTERLGNRGVVRKLNEEEEKKVENFVLHCESSHKHCGIEEVISFCGKELDWKPSSSWVSKFLKSRETSIRSHVVQKRPAKRNREKIDEDIEKFREELEDFRTKRARGRVWHMDETGLWNDPIHKKSYSRVGVTPMELTTNDHGRDTVVLTCREDGKKMNAFYIRHQSKKYKNKFESITGKRIKIVEDKGISGMNNSLMMDWCKWLIEQPEINLKKDIICFDQHRSHVNEKVITYLENSGLKVLPFPKGSAAELSMLDNSLFKDFKNNFNKAWIKKGRKKEEKESLVHEIWAEFPSKNIKGYWKKCGYTPKTLLRKSKSEKIEVKKKIVSIVKKTSAKTNDIRQYFSK